VRELQDELKKEIIKDFNRARKALKSAKKNFKDDDIFTAANRIFVACENALYTYLKLKFGGTTISRKRITIRMIDINPSFKEIYESSYDLRVQADYGRKSRIAELNKKNVREIIRKVEKLISETEIELKNDNI
jgi:uncharacterized protein (UPF0332 family)